MFISQIRNALLNIGKCRHTNTSSWILTVANLTCWFIGQKCTFYSQNSKLMWDVLDRGWSLYVKLSPSSPFRQEVISSFRFTSTYKGFVVIYLSLKCKLYMVPMCHIIQTTQVIVPWQNISNTLWMFYTCIDPVRGISIFIPGGMVRLFRVVCTVSYLVTNSGLPLFCKDVSDLICSKLSPRCFHYPILSRYQGYQSSIGW